MTQIEVPPVWNTVFDALFGPVTTGKDQVVQECPDIDKVRATESRIAVFGGKRAGKSTYNKWLVNQLLEQGQTNGNDDACVLYIEVDPGQPEFTPPGVISVSKINQPVDGSNTSHLSRPIMSKYIGSVNITECPLLYLQCVRELFDFIRQEESFQNIPWVMNTMGFLKGLGLSLTCKVVCMYNPTIVMQILMEEDNRFNSQPFLFDAPSVSNYMMTQERRYIADTGVPVIQYQFITFDSVFNDFLGRRPIIPKAKVLRDEVIVAYFDEIAKQTEDNNLLAYPPRVISLSSIGIGTMTSSTLSYDDILQAMNGNLVALCKFPQHALVSSSHQNNNRMVVNASRYSNEFYGYGIVRCIERRKEQNTSLYITTPVPQDILKNDVNCIITAGNIGLPTQLYLSGLGEDRITDFGQDQDPEVSYVVSKRQLKSKLNEPTKRQFVAKRMKHNVLNNCLK